MACRRIVADRGNGLVRVISTSSAKQALANLFGVVDAAFLPVAGAAGTGANTGSPGTAKKSYGARGSAFASMASTVLRPPATHPLQTRAPGEVSPSFAAATGGAVGGADGGDDDEDDDDDEEEEEEEEDGVDVVEGSRTHGNVGSDGRWDPFAASRRRRALAACEALAAALCAALTDQPADGDGGGASATARLNEVGNAAAALVAR